jgi:AP-1 complex subunit mu
LHTTHAPTARCHFTLPSVEAEEEAHSKMPPIKVKFEIPYFTVSGMQVRVAWLWACAR